MDKQAEVWSVSPAPHEHESQESREESNEVHVPVLAGQGLHLSHCLYHHRRGHHLEREIIAIGEGISCSKRYVHAQAPCNVQTCLPKTMLQ